MYSCWLYIPELFGLVGMYVYSVIEPCAMCLTCASWVDVSRIVFGAYLEDIAKNSYLLEQYHAEKFARNLTSLCGKSIEVTGGILRDDCRNIMEKVQNWIVI